MRRLWRKKLLTLIPAFSRREKGQKNSVVRPIAPGERQIVCIFSWFEHDQTIATEKIRQN
jgi:hypothetical protein